MSALPVPTAVLSTPCPAIPPLPSQPQGQKGPLGYEQPTQSPPNPDTGVQEH